MSKQAGIPNQIHSIQIRSHLFLLTVPILSNSPNSHHPSNVPHTVFRFGTFLPYPISSSPITTALSTTNSLPSSSSKRCSTAVLLSGPCTTTTGAIALLPSPACRLAMLNALLTLSTGDSGDRGINPGTRRCSSGMTSSLGEPGPGSSV